MHFVCMRQTVPCLARESVGTCVHPPEAGVGSMHFVCMRQTARVGPASQSGLVELPLRRRWIHRK